MSYFKWDEYLKKAKYKDIVNSQFFGFPYAPPMVSPNGKYVYIKALDIDVKTNDYEFLNEILLEVLRRLIEKSVDNRWSYHALYLLEVDYLLIANILNNAGKLPEDYRYPEFYLQQAKDAKAYP